jgi:glyoxylase-like metal-dependent hydrolase (beta-lactamase superfamily II)
MQTTNIGNVRVIFGYDGSNTYVFGDVVVDPGFTTEFGTDLKDVKIVINTHTHFDHIKNNYLFKNAKIYAHELDLPAINEGKNICAEMFGEKPIKIKAQKIPEKIRGWKVIHTPGHTKGSISLYEPKEKILICGDLCFSDGVGRTDLYGGSEQELIESLKKVSKLDVKYLLPGHGPIGGKQSIIRGLHETKSIL